MRHLEHGLWGWLGPWRIEHGYWWRPAVTIDGQRVRVLGPAAPTARTGEKP